MIKSRRFLAYVTLLTVAVLAFVWSAGPVSHGPWPFPDDDTGGSIVAHGPWPFPDDDTGGGFLAHGPWPFPDDDTGGSFARFA